MRILVIGGNGFIGAPLMRELRDAGHDIAVLHSGGNADPPSTAGIITIQGDRNRLPDYRKQIQQFSPDVITDLILSSGEQAQQLVRVITRSLTSTKSSVKRPDGKIKTRPASSTRNHLITMPKMRLLCSNLVLSPYSHNSHSERTGRSSHENRVHHAA